MHVLAGSGKELVGQVWEVDNAAARYTFTAHFIDEGEVAGVATSEHVLSEPKDVADTSGWIARPWGDRCAVPEQIGVRRVDRQQHVDLRIIKRRQFDVVPDLKQVID